MSSSSITTSIFLSFLILFVCSVSVLVLGGNQSNTTTLDITSLLSGECSNGTGFGPNSMKMVHSYGACAPPGSNKTLPTFKDFVASDQIRLVNIARLMGINGSYGGDQFPSQLTLQSVSMAHLTLVIQVWLGPQKARQIVTVDTGSDLCWVTCTPCAGPCHTQVDPVYTPSPLYSKVLCSDSMCSALGEFQICQQGTNECQYRYSYGDQTNSVGALGRETLTLTSTDQIPNFVFGCTNSLGGNTLSQLPQDGLFGMGRGSLSLISQVAPRYGNVFSFCIPRSSSSVGYLELGPTTGTGVYYTPMLTSCPGSGSLYFVDLTGISVSGVMLNVPPADHAPCTTIVDSGTTFTLLRPSIYNPLAEAFMSGMSSTYRLIPRATPDDPICYETAGLTTMTVPGIRLYFQGGFALQLAGNQIMIVDATQACLGFQPSKLGINIIGYTQQRMYEVVYDSGNSRVGFGPGSC